MREIAAFQACCFDCRYLKKRKKTAYAVFFCIKIKLKP